MKIQSSRAMKLLFALGLVGLSSCALAASFDCGKAANATEKLICSDAKTSALDSKLQHAYKTALVVTNAYGKKALAKEQRSWLTYTRGICQDTACLRKVYIARIAVLERNEKNIVNGESYCIMPSGVDHVSGHACGVYVMPYRDTNDRISSFNQTLALQKQSSKIINCSQLIELPLGTTHGDNTFGGVCILQEGPQRKDVEICNDDMGGAFQMEPISPQDFSNKHLIDFTYAQCYAPPTTP